PVAGACATLSCDLNAALASAPNPVRTAARLVSCIGFLLEARLVCAPVIVASRAFLELFSSWAAVRPSGGNHAGTTDGGQVRLVEAAELGQDRLGMLSEPRRRLQLHHRRPLVADRAVGQGHRSGGDRVVGEETARMQ